MGVGGGGGRRAGRGGVPMFVRLMYDGPFSSSKEDRLALPLSTPLSSSRRSMAV